MCPMSVVAETRKTLEEPRRSLPHPEDLRQQVQGPPLNTGTEAVARTIANRWDQRVRLMMRSESAQRKAQPPASLVVRSFMRLWTAQMSRHSLLTAVMPRPLNRRHRKLALMLPKTGSTLTLRFA